jgi:signal transduction histidine kinase
VNSHLHILHLEDDPTDVRLVRDTLAAEGLCIDTTVVAKREDFLDALDRGGFDLVLADYMLPGFDGLEALALVRRRSSYLPFVFFTGAMGEERAIESLKSGATDYVLKDRLSRLVPVIRRALDEAQECLARQAAEEARRQMEDDLRNARDDLEVRVRERTAELMKYRERLEELVRERTRELERANEKLRSEILERNRAEDSLRQARAAAEAASKAKSQFLANVSHELRTPMNAILGMVRLALARQADPTAKELLETANESAGLLLALLNDLLDCAKIESGKLEMQAAPFSLRHVLDQSTQVLAVRASERGIAFSCSIPPEVPDVLIGDQVRIRQVLINLGGNAIKFTDRGEVTVGVRLQSQETDAASLEFVVRDTGIGIPECQLEKIFQPFAQAEGEANRRFGGTGLGLAISANLVSQMGGRIWVESQPDQGSTFHFTVRLPLGNELPSEPDRGRGALAAAPPRLRVLVVDDNPANQKLASFILQERGHAVDIAASGQQGLDMVGLNRYDVILMDVQMPGMDGLEATKVLRDREQGAYCVPIIAVTAHAMKGDRERCRAAGMNDYLSKPIDGYEMIAMVERLAVGQSTGSAVPLASSPSDVESTAVSTLPVFDLNLATRRCLENKDMLQQMIAYFYEECDVLFPQMRAVLQQGNFPELGRLGHRLKGTLVYIGAEPAREAAASVEHFEIYSGDSDHARAALDLLEERCEVLKTALAERETRECQIGLASGK